MEKGWTLQEKQNYLRSQIIDSGVDPECFMVFMGNQKGQGLDINLENWSVKELKSVVNNFKISLSNELKREHNSRLNSDQELARNRASQITASRVIGMKSLIKDKVFYDRDDLWDVEMQKKQVCKKGFMFFNPNVNAQIICKQVEVKKCGGFIFGIGGKNCIHLTLYSNVSSQPIVRLSQDADWLKKVLSSQFPGMFIPPLTPTPVFKAQDAVVIKQRAKEIMVFLGILVKHQHLINNKFVHMFLTESNSKAFENFKNKNENLILIKDPSKVETPQGCFDSEVSQKVMDFIKNSTKFSREAEDIYKNLKQCLFRYQKDLQAVAKSSHSLSVIFRVYQQKFGFFSEKCNFNKNKKSEDINQKMIMSLKQIKQSFLHISSQNKRESQMFRDLLEDQIDKNAREWTEFNVFVNGYRKELDNYLGEKLNFHRKKQQFFLQRSREELEQRQKTGFCEETSLQQKQTLYKKLNPLLSQQEQRKKTNIGYHNSLFEKCFMSVVQSQEYSLERKFIPVYTTLSNLLNQRVILYKEFVGKLKEKHEALNQQEKGMKN